MVNHIWEVDEEGEMRIMTYDRDILIGILKGHFERRGLSFSYRLEEDHDGILLLKGEEPSHGTMIFEAIYDGSVHVRTIDTILLDFLKGLGEEDVF